MAFAAALFIRAGTLNTFFVGREGAGFFIMDSLLGCTVAIVGTDGALAICAGTLDTIFNRRVMFHHKSSGEVKANPLPVLTAMSFFRVK
jgi:hypothetical protein